jgi:hypothetical protein
MTFLQPWLLWGLPLVLLPVVIHLLNRLRYRNQPWAAMQFLLAATRQSTSQARLRHFLILLCRVLAVLALVLWLARPLSGGWFGWFISGAPDAILLLLDRSASMEARAAADSPTRREQALQTWTEALQPFRGTSRFALIESSLRTPEGLVDPAELGRHPLVRATDTAADLPALLQAAVNWILEQRPGTSELWIASDLQRSDWRPEDPRWETVRDQLAALPQRVRVRLLVPDLPLADNVGVTLHDAIRRTVAGRPSLQLTFDLERGASAESSLPVLLSLSGAESQFEVRLEGNSVRWRHTVPLPESSALAPGWGGLQLPADANLRDNRVFFVYGQEAVPRALVVAENQAVARPLRLAAASAVTNRFEPARWVVPGEGMQALSSDPALLIWQGAVPAGAEASRLEEYVRAGGLLFWLPPQEGEAGVLAGASWGGVEVAPADRPFAVAQWDQSQGLLAKTEEGWNLPLNELQIDRRRSLTGSWLVLATYADGAPFFGSRALGRGAIYACTSLPQEQWSSLGDGPVLVPWTQRLLHLGSRRFQAAFNLECGEIVAADEAQAWVSLERPGESDIRWDAGVYRRGDRWVAVNRPASENEPVYLELAEAQALFGTVPTTSLRQRATGTDRLPGEIWRMVLLGMLASLLLEASLLLPSARSATGAVATTSVRRPSAAPASAS